MRARRILPIAILVVSFFMANGIGVQAAPDAAPRVTVAPIPAVVVHPGTPAKVQIHFRVAEGFHINSRQPKSDLLIPTDLRLDPPSNIVVGKAVFPPGHELTLDFAPDEKLDVYSGDFQVTASVTANRTVTPGTYPVHGTLKYQACSNRSCFAPRELPVDFDVNVQPATHKTSSKQASGQSPRVHH